MAKLYVLVWGLLWAVGNVNAAEWGYSGSGAPAYWGAMSPEFSICSDGKAQSPINIEVVEESLGAPIIFEYQHIQPVIEDNGHALVVNIEQEMFLNVGDQQSKLIQFHTHAPSEHTIEGKQYPLEIHFVHQNDEGRLSVVGLMVTKGERNPHLDKIVQNINNVDSLASLELSSLMPEDMSYYRYDGSLTTPPCSEGVKWHVIQEPIEASEEQLAAFIQQYTNNARPVQPLNNRVVFEVLQ